MIGSFLLFAVGLPCLAISLLIPATAFGRALRRLGWLATGSGIAVLLIAGACQALLERVPAPVSVLAWPVASLVAYGVLESRKEAPAEEWTDFRKLGGKDRVTRLEPADEDSRAEDA